MNPVIVADDRIPFLKGVLEPYCTVRYCPGGKITSAEVRDADALIVRTRTRCDEALLRDSKVRMIASATIGYDHLDTAYLEKRNIMWRNAPGCNASSVRQYIAGALLGIAARHRLTLRGMTLGVVGVGHVGKLVAELGEKWGMRVLRNDPPRADREGMAGFCSFEESVREADFLTFHVPLDETTRGMVQTDQIGQMKPSAFLLNASRGEVVSGTALKAALLVRRIAGAVLDVWENEPDIDRELLQLLEYGTPHIAGYSADGKANGTAACVRNAAEFFGIEELRDWTPGTLPAPPEVREPETGLPEEERRRRILKQFYDIAEDDSALRQAPDTFEALRGSCRIRREPAEALLWQ